MAEAPDLAVWRALRAELDAGRPAALAVVVGHEGRSPGRAGQVLAVGRAGRLAGTTGGGPAEDAVVAAALGLVRDPDGMGVRLLTQTHRRGAADASGLLCGGQQRVAVVRLGSDAAAGIGRVEAALTRGNSAIWTVSDAGWRLGDAVGSPGERWSSTHTSGPSHRVVIVGAGHVGTALAPLLVGLGFRVTVVDERPGAADRLLGGVHEVATLPYEDLAGVVPPGDRTFVVVAAHAPDRDAAAVAALAGVRLGYLGVLGTPAKLAGLPARAAAPAVEVPAGVPVGSHTPEEIAVSVAARLVAVRARASGALR